MSDVKRRPLAQTRLKQLASESHLPVNPKQPPVQDDSSPVTFLQAPQIKEAKDMLAWRRTWDVEYKAPAMAFSSKSHEAAFSFDEVNRALKAVVTDNGSPGLVEALLNINRDRKGSFWDKIKGSVEQRDCWHDLLRTALRNRSYDLVRLLASRADTAALNSALPVALRSSDTIGTRILLERGADLNDLHAEFMSIMTGANEELLELLICAPRPPCHTCRSEAVIIACQRGSLHFTALLVRRGIDANWRDWAAIRGCIQNRRKDLLVAIVSGPRPPTPATLDAAVGYLYGLWNADIDYTAKLVEVLLCAGGRGDCTANVLLIATKSRQVELIDLLISYGASVDFGNGAVIKHAVVLKDAQLLARLLRGKPTPGTLSAVLQSTDDLLLDDLVHSKETIGRLLGAGLRGDAVDQFLLKAVVLCCQSGVRQEDRVRYAELLDLIQMLLAGNHSDVNVNAAEPLKTAVRLTCPDVIRLMLGKSPTESSINAAFSEAINIPADAAARLEVMELLLDAGARGPVVDQALVSSIQRGHGSVEESRLLVRAASVDYDQGAALSHAISGGWLEQLDILLAAHPQSLTLQHSWDVAAKLENVDYQYQIYERLLEVDATAAPLARELVAAITKGNTTQRTIKLLLDHGAEVEANDGLPLAAAVDSQNVVALRSMLDRKPSAPSLRNAAQKVWHLTGQKRLEVAQLLLSYGMDQSSRDNGLLVAVGEDAHDLLLITLLLEFDASPELNHGEAVTKAARKGDHKLLATLVEHVSNPENLTDALGFVLHQPSWQTTGLPLLSCLFGRGAKGPWVDPAFIQCCASYNFNAFDILLGHISSTGALTDALRAIVVQDLKWQSPDGLLLMQNLLSHGASGTILGPAFIQAAAAFNASAVMLLKDYVRDADVFTIAWDEATLTSDAWLEESSQPILQLLLDSGARADLDLTLIRAVAASSGPPELPGLVDLLLRYGANAGYNDHQSLRMAAGAGNAALVQMLCQYEPPSEVLFRAVFDLIQGYAGDDTRQVVTCLWFLLTCPTAKPNLNTAPDGMDPPLIQVLTKFPNSPDLVQVLVQNGDVDVMSKATCPLLLVGTDDWRSVYRHRQGPVGPAGLRLLEELPALLWALMQPKTEMDDSVIEIMIDLGADVNFSTPHLALTPLILAAKHGRPAVITKLLQHGALRDMRDHFDNTALLYASRHGYLDCVSILIQEFNPIDDGSLHEASRNLHFEVVELLIKAGYNPNFESEVHGGRTPLGELCLLCDGGANDEALEKTLDALAVGGADPLKKCGLKLPIFLAMANSRPGLVVEKLIERLMSVQISSPAIIYEQDELAYSTTMYIKKLILPSGGQVARAKRVPSAGYSSIPYPFEGELEDHDTPPVSRAFHLATSTAFNELLSFLMKHGVKDRFYYTGLDLVQPGDMAGAPDNIAGRENERRERMQAIQEAWGHTRLLTHHETPPREQTTRDSDELHIWDSNTRKEADIQWRLAEENRQVQNRRALSDLVSQHMDQHQIFHQEAGRLRVEACNRQRLDLEALQTEWQASEMVTTGSAGAGLAYSMQRHWGYEEEARHVLAETTETRLAETKRAKARMFPNVTEWRVASRPGAQDWESSATLVVRTRLKAETDRNS